METEELGRIMERAAEDVFGTMLGTQLDVGAAFESEQPFGGAEVTGRIGLAGAFEGWVALHASREQGRDFAARLLGTRLDAIGASSEIRDAIGEIANMIAGNVKRDLAGEGGVEITLPSVRLAPQAPRPVDRGRSIVLPLADYTGAFHLELMVSGARGDG